ncbi:MAG: VanW family protein [Lewinellaceae bacterium]|nr:VanW family protein [Saprospiraceae bacterium]MCB9312256.1 VanW family protein [Lewinellaceae bacterium]
MIHNLRLAGKRMEAFVIHPGEILSFWRMVGPPDLNHGFRSSRSIVGTGLSQTIGGGLCQLSGVIYYLSLQLETGDTGTAQSFPGYVFIGKTVCTTRL